MATQSKSKNRKTKRSRSAISGNPNSYKHLYKNSNQQVVPSEEVADISVGVTTGKGSETVDWSSEYSYVFKDLRTLLIVSFAIFVAMIGSQFFL
ncbi:MAG: hypothetical protein AAF702_11570 [Chloroflexota bacterium]